MHKHCVTHTETHLLYREPYILTGYRRDNQPYTYYINSLFNKHNETINVYSHFIGVIYNLYLGFSTDFSDPYSWPILTGLIASTIMFLTSALAHLMHSKSHLCHMTCFFFDYAGIALIGFGSVVMQNYISSPLWYYSAIENFLLPLIGFKSMLISVVLPLSITKYTRPFTPFKVFLQIISCAPIWLFGIFTVLMRLFLLADDSTVIIHFPYHYIHIIAYALGAMFFATDFPQVLLPGNFDFIGHSHNLFHLCIFIFVVFQHKACYWDYLTNREIIAASRCPPTFLFCFGSLLAIVVYNGFVIYQFNRMIAHNFEKSGEFYR